MVAVAHTKTANPLFTRYGFPRQNHSMAFSIDMSAAAKRHLTAAELLFAPKGRKDVAGYLFGIAAECAVKAMMSEAGLRPERDNRDDPFYKHFPTLRTLLRDTLHGRRGATLFNLINSDEFMNNWSTDMRYSNGKDIDDRWIDDWAEQARRVVASIGT